MDGFERRRQQKKDAILGAALELFKQYGYNKVSIAEIAKKASVSQVSIYNFFNSKEDLKHELLIKGLDERYNETINILKNNNPIEIRLKNLIATRTDLDINASMLFYLESVENDIHMQEYFETITQKTLDAMVHFCEEGKREGIFNELISTQAMIFFIEIFQYYITHNHSAIEKFRNNPELLKEIFSLGISAIMKK